MEHKTVTPVQVIQELIAMLTTRKEAIDKIMSKPDAASLAADLKNDAQQTDDFIAGLQSELSGFGDAVMADVDRNNVYHQLWREGLEMEATASAAQLHRHFQKMEETLYENYEEYNNTGMQLPETLSGLIQRQQDELKR